MNAPTSGTGPGSQLSTPYKPVILITGCGSGIGLALAELLEAQLGYRIVVTARAHSIPALRVRFPETDRFTVRALDVKVESQREGLVADVASTWGGVNILINNAGVSYRAVVEHMSDSEEQNQFDVNYFGPVGLIRAVLPGMRQVGRGKIINVSSVSGRLAMPTMGSYSASKYALEGLSEALWYEMRPFGINVTLIQPGFVRSNSFLKVRHAVLAAPERSVDGLYGDYYANMTPFIERLMNLSLTTPQQIARRILKVIHTRNPPLWIPTTLDAMTFYYLRRFLPRKFLLPFLFAALPRVREWGRRHTNAKRWP